MKKLLSVLFIAILFIGCSKESKSIETIEGESIEKRNNAVNHLEYNTLFTQAFPNVNFDNFWLVVHDGESYKYGSGVDLDGNSFEARISDGKKESCSGVGCSKCRILAGGGCTCDKKETSSGYCNHTVTEDIRN